MITWINGPFGGGKTTTARGVVAEHDSARLFDPESVGYMLMHHLQGIDVDDFQELASWRRLVPEVIHEIATMTGDDLVAVQSVLRLDYWNELREGLERRGHEVRHIVLTADVDVIRQRIASDTAEPDAARWRLDHLAAFEDALYWLTEAADAIIDTTERSPAEVAAVASDVMMS